MGGYIQPGGVIQHVQCFMHFVEGACAMFDLNSISVGLQCILDQRRRGRQRFPWRMSAMMEVESTRAPDSGSEDGGSSVDSRLSKSKQESRRGPGRMAKKVRRAWN